MPIVFEVIALMLLAYLFGLAIGWILWSRLPSDIGDR